MAEAWNRIPLPPIPAGLVIVSGIVLLVIGAAKNGNKKTGASL